MRFGRVVQSGSRGSASTVMKSAFDNDEGYELTSLGSQFVHYAMTDLPPKIEFKMEKGSGEVNV